MNGEKWLENAAFLKLRNISLSYDIPKDWVKFADIQLSVSGQNVLTLTKYTGMDPGCTTRTKAWTRVLTTAKNLHVWREVHVLRDRILNTKKRYNMRTKYTILYFS